MIKINWKTKSRLLSAFDLLGQDALNFAQKHLSRRSVVDLPVIPKAWAFQKRNVAEYRPHELIEFGAGKNLGQNLFIAQPGLRQYVVDLNPMLDLELVNHVITLLRERHNLDDLAAVSSLEELVERYAITYEAPVDMAETHFEDGRFDMCISSNTLEHIPVASLSAILTELRRILRKGGLICAQIDYSDHYSHTDRSISRLNYLRFHEQQWSRYNHRVFYQNRLRHNHYRALFDQAGFVTLRAEAQSPCEQIPADLEPSLLTGDESDFCKTGHWVLQNP